MGVQVNLFRALFKKSTSVSDLLVRANISTTSRQNQIKNVTVFGGGVMGSGIAQISAQTGHNVILVDTKDEFLQKSKKIINGGFQRAAKKQFKGEEDKAKDFVSQVQGKMQYILSSDLAKAVEDCDLVMEAVIENLEVKQNLFADVEKVAPEKTILASNTSSIPITEIGAKVKRQDRFCGLHFFSPVVLMKLLEVIRTDSTSDETHKKIMSWGKAIGKKTVNCKDTPGFIVNRLLIPYCMSAIALIERGDATFQDVDIAMKMGAGYPMGPFELSDSVGLDTSYNIITGWEKRFPGDPNFKVPETLKKKVAEKKFGIKSGEGFYKYNEKGQKVK